MKHSKFTFTPFSRKQEAVLTWWCKNSPYKDKDGIICDGSIRSGKTTVMSLSFVLWAMTNFDGMDFAMCGKTVLSLRRNVINQLKQMVCSLGYVVTEHRSENYISIVGGESENDFYLFGGKDESSQDLIQGITLAGVFFDEVALMPESFVNQATGRCSVRGSKLWFNCNPESPDHYIKTQWIDNKTALNLIRIHFTMHDNPSLAPEIVARYERMYSGVFYERFILGLWVVASGVIFKYLAENPKPYVYDPNDEDDEDDEDEKDNTYTKLVMGIDFGGNGSMTTFCLSGYKNGYKDIRVLEEDDLPLTENIDAKNICDKFVEFYTRCRDKYGRVDWVFPDSASTTLINSLRSVARDNGIPTQHIKGCRKNEISERPKTLDMLLCSGRLLISKRCPKTLKALQTLRWDEKHPDEPEDKNEGNCNDRYDAFMYTLLDFIEFIDLGR